MEKTSMHHTTFQDDLPKFAGPHTPSKKLEPYLKYLFPYVDDARSNIFFRYRKYRGFFPEFQRFWDNHERPLANDITIVIENGAKASKMLDKKFESLGIGSKRTSCMYNCYQLVLEHIERGSFTIHLYDSIRSLVSPDYINITVGWGSGNKQLEGPIVYELTDDQISQNAFVDKIPDFGFLPEYRLHVSRALDMEPMPTLIGEVTKSHTADSLFMAVKSWLGGSKLLVESVLAVNLWHETLSIVFYQFDCRVENLVRLLDQYRGDDWKAQCLHLVIRYKCLRWLIELQLIRFLIEHPHENFEPLRDWDITEEVEERFRQANRVISDYTELLQGLGDTQTYTIIPQRGLDVCLEDLIRHQDEINDSIGYYEDILRTLSPDDEVVWTFPKPLSRLASLSLIILFLLLQCSALLLDDDGLCQSMFECQYRLGR